MDWQIQLYTILSFSNQSRFARQFFGQSSVSLRLTAPFKRSLLGFRACGRVQCFPVALNLRGIPASNKAILSL